MTTGDPELEAPGESVEDLRRQLDEARNILRAIRAAGFDDRAIDTGEDTLTFSSSYRPYRLLVEGTIEGERTYFRAVALDFDGTLADGAVAPETLAALDQARSRGIRVILATGRIMDELRAVFPQVEAHVDAVVAENGAIMVTPVGVRLLATPINRAVSLALTERGVPHRDGQVLIACAAADEPAALEVVRVLGLDCQLVRNRTELMILPAGVTKGGGVLEALDDLGLSAHNTIGVGDAENDHSLLDVCEIGVAVANAVDSIKAHADVDAWLARRARSGRAAPGAAPRRAGAASIPAAGASRWRRPGGQAVTLPASQINVAVCGGTGTGKSYLAGLICEQLIGLCYSLVVFDPEGDHVGLGELRGVLVTGGDNRPLADPARGRAASCIGAAPRSSSTCRNSTLPARMLTRQGRSSRPARRSPASPSGWSSTRPSGPSAGPALASGCSTPSDKGYLLVTWQPEELSAQALAGLDVVIALGSPEPPDPLVDLTAAVAELPRAEVARLLQGPVGRAVLAWRAHPHQAVPFTLGPSGHSPSSPRTQVRHLRGRTGSPVLFQDRAGQPDGGGCWQPGRARSRTRPLRPGRAPPSLPRPRLFPLGRWGLPRPTTRRRHRRRRRRSPPAAPRRSSKRCGWRSSPHFRPVAPGIPACRCRQTSSSRVV